MEAEQASAPDSLQSQSDSESHMASMTENTEAGSSMIDASEAQHPFHQALDEFLNQSPWLMLPKEISTGTRIDEETGRSYMYLNNAPVNDYLALAINDGKELAAGGDPEYLANFARTHLIPSERYHVVVIPEKNVQMAGVARWEDIVGELNHGWFEGSLTSDEHGSEMIKAGTKTDNGENRERSFQPFLAPFLPQKVFAKSPTPPPPSPQPDHASPLPQQQEVQTGVPGDDLLQRNSQRTQPTERHYMRFTDSELKLFQDYFQFSMVRLEHALSNLEQPILSTEEKRVLQSFICFLSHQESLQQKARTGAGGDASGQSNNEDRASDSTSNTQNDDLRDTWLRNGMEETNRDAELHGSFQVQRAQNGDLNATHMHPHMHQDDLPVRSHNDCAFCRHRGNNYSFQ